MFDVNRVSERGVSSAQRLVYITTEWTAADWHLRGQLRFMQDRGWDVTLITGGPDHEIARIADREGVRAIACPMKREIDPVADLRSLVDLVRILRQIDPHVVNASTPKAGLLGMMAARALGIPQRVYTLRGLRLETLQGAKRIILHATERIAVRAAHHVVCVSPSLREAAIAHGIVSVDRAIVIGKGSSNGVEIERFAPNPDLTARAAALRGELGIPRGAAVVGFVGRMVHDKGIEPLVDAYLSLVSRHQDLYLLLVGGFEQGDPVSERVRNVCATHPRILQVGFTKTPEPYFHLMDVLAFPSLREGLPNVPLQAAAAGTPVVGFDTTGTRDAILDGHTGALAPLGDAQALEGAIERYVTDPELRRIHGDQAQEWVARIFRPEVIWQGIDRLYRRDLPAPSAPQDA